MWTRLMLFHQRTSSRKDHRNKMLEKCCLLVKVTGVIYVGKAHLEGRINSQGKKNVIFKFNKRRNCNNKCWKKRRKRRKSGFPTIKGPRSPIKWLIQLRKSTSMTIFGKVRLTLSEVHSKKKKRGKRKKWGNLIGHRKFMMGKQQITHHLRILDQKVHISLQSSPQKEWKLSKVQFFHRKRNSRIVTWFS